MSGTVEAWICDSRFRRIVPLDQFSRLSAALVVRGWSVFVIDLATQTVDKSLIGKDRVIEIGYSPDGGTSRLLVVGWIRKRVFYDDDNGQERVTLTCFGPNYLLSGRIIAYASGTAQASMTDYADDMLKAIVYDNLGGDASGSRNLSSLGVAVDTELSDGPSITKSFAWKPMLDVLDELCQISEENGTRLFYGLEPEASSAGEIDLTFRTYTGQPGANRGAGSGNELHFGKAWGNLDKPELEEDWSDEITYVYAGGQGEGSDRTVSEVSDALRLGESIWSRREAFADSRNETSSGGVQSKAYAVLNEGKPVIRFRGLLKDTPLSRYRLDWDLGDIVFAEYQDYTFNVMVSAVSFGLDENGKLSIAGQFSVIDVNP